MATVTIPTELRVGGLTYRVDDRSSEDPNYVNEAGEQRRLYGRCDRDSQVIELYDHATTPNLANTVLHELLHAVWGEYGLDNSAFRKHEERIVTALSNGLCAALVNNPDLLPVLDALLHGPIEEGAS